MLQTNRSPFVFLTLCLISICWTGAFGQNNRSAVSLTGVDTASCTVPDPCRTFDAAIFRTNPGGEIVVLSSAGYGPFTVNKSVSIISPGGIHAALAPTTGAAITVDGSAIDVFLRNLWINSLGATDGITILNARQLHIENCTITGFSNSGINAVMSNDLFGSFWMSVVDSFLRLNATGIAMSSGGLGISRLTVDRTRVENNSGNAISITPGAGGSVDGIIRESLITANGAGIFVSTSNTSHTNVEGCAFVHNPGTALQGGGTSTRVIRVSQSYIANNGAGLATGGGDDLQSFGNNRLTGNGSDGAFTSTIALK